MGVVWQDHRLIRLTTVLPFWLPWWQCQNWPMLTNLSACITIHLDTTSANSTASEHWLVVCFFNNKKTKTLKLKKQQHIFKRKCLNIFKEMNRIFTIYANPTCKANFFLYHTLVLLFTTALTKSLFWWQSLCFSDHRRNDSRFPCQAEIHLHVWHLSICHHQGRIGVKMLCNKYS